MKNMLLFLQEEIPKAQHLETLFGHLKEKEWNIRSYINELFVQVGQLLVALGKEASSITEKGRPIDTIGDELSDILLSLTYLASSQKTNDVILEEACLEKSANIEDLIILAAQISEAYMEIVGERFRKSHEGKTSEEFFEDRIFRMMVVCFNIAKLYQLDVREEFNKMCDRAVQFVSEKMKEQKEISVSYQFLREENNCGVS